MIKGQSIGSRIRVVLIWEEEAYDVKAGKCKSCWWQERDNLLFQRLSTFESYRSAILCRADSCAGSHHCHVSFVLFRHILFDSRIRQGVSWEIYRAECIYFWERLPSTFWKCILCDNKRKNAGFYNVIDCITNFAYWNIDSFYNKDPYETPCNFYEYWNVY